MATTYRTYITKSRAGHYSVSVYRLDASHPRGKCWVYGRGLLSTAPLARLAAQEFIAAQQDI